MRAADLFLRLFLHLQYVLWYTHNMMVSKKKVMTKKKKISPVLIFFLTLGGILLVGLSGLLFLSLQTGKRGAQQAWNTDADENRRQDDLEGKDNAEAGTPLHSLWQRKRKSHMQIFCGIRNIWLPTGSMRRRAARMAG